jgi:DNA-binding XRE family transcriptional regulator
MESLFISNQEFFEGADLFTASSDEILFIRPLKRSGYTSRSRNRENILATARKFVISLSVGAAMSTALAYPIPVMASASPPWRLEELAVPPERAPDAQQFRQAREALGMTQRMAATVLHVSEPALEQYEQGRVTPGSAFGMRYQALIDLYDLIHDAFPDNPKLVSTFLHHPGPFFGGAPPVNWAITADTDAIQRILAYFRHVLP